VTSEVRQIDLLFIPKRDASPLGLLGRMAQTPCILEPYRNALTSEEVRICLLKLRTYEAEQRRIAEREKRKLTPGEQTRLWIVAPTISQAIVREFAAQRPVDWPRGVYFAPKGFRVVLVAVHQLPVSPKTLWLRVLGRDGVQKRAIQELLELPPSDPLRMEVLRLLMNWQIGLQQRQESAAEEATMAVQLSQAYLEWEQQTKQEGKLEVVPSLLSRGFSVAQIAEILGVSIDQVASVTPVARSTGA